MEASSLRMEAEDDVHSLFSIPLSSLFNFQRSPPPGNGRQLHHQQQQQQLQQSNAFGYFTSQSSADSAHFSGMELGFDPAEMDVDSHFSFPVSSLSGKPNHSEVEKLRRDRMNNSIGEMADLVPSCKSASRKLDKLTVLRLAAQHIKLVRARTSSMLHSPAEIFCTEELQRLLSQSASLQGFILVVECDRARILCATNCGNCGIPGVCLNSSDLIGQCFLDMVHPKDAELVKRQLELPDLMQRQCSPTEPVLNFCLRRRFYCRFRATFNGGGGGSGPAAVKRKGEGRQFVYMSCSGVLHWSEPLPDSHDKSSQAAQQLQSACLALVCRPAEPLNQSALPATVRSCQDWQFMAKLSLEGCFTWIDQRVASILGHLPQDLQGSSLYDLVAREDVNRFSLAHRSALKGTRSRVTCRVGCAWPAAASGGCCPSSALCQLSLLSFINPCTGRPELLSLTCTLNLIDHPETDGLAQPPALGPLLSFPSVQPVEAATAQTGGAGGSRSAQLGCRIATEVLQSLPPLLQLPPPATATARRDASCAGWQALSQLIGASQSGSGSAGDQSLSTTRMTLLDADGGLGDEPDYNSMLWPL